MAKRVSQAERDFVRQHFASLGAAEIGRRLGRTKASVQHIHQELDHPTRTRGDAWTEEQQAILARDYPTLGARAVAEVIGRTEGAVRHRAARHGIRTVEEDARLRTLATKRAKLYGQYVSDGITTKQAWVAFVLRRDDYACRDCGLREPPIVVAHHIVPRYDDPSRTLDPNNGVTLCPNCHARRHLALRRSKAVKVSERDRGIVFDLRMANKTVSEISIDLGINEKSVNKYLRSQA